MSSTALMGLFGPITWARPRHSFAGILASIMLAPLAFPLLTGGVQNPDLAISAPPRPQVAAAPTAILSGQGDDLLITGSVAHLFDTGSFEGPNRAEKVNRSRLTPDGITISSGFDGIRTRLAQLRNPDGTLPLPSAAPAEIQIASLDPSESAALGAIDQIMPMAPMPMSPTKTLAYARETTPATAFDVSVDRFGGKVSQKDIHCMATAIYFEARGESYRGQVAVGQVVMNRMAHRVYPKSICAVVFQNQQMRNACQFSFACDGIPETINEGKSWKQADQIARGVIDGSLYLTEVGKATHYHANYVYPHWAPKLKRLTKIDHHIFYQFKRA